MKATRLMAAAVLIASGLALQVAQAQQSGITRTDLLKAPHRISRWRRFPYFAALCVIL